MGTLIIFISCVLILFVYGQDNDHPWRTLYCPFTQENLIGSNLSDQFRVEYIKIGEYIKIPCCQKYSLNATKRFYHRNRFFTDEEKPLKYHEEPAWYIHNIDNSVTGAYYCKDDFATTTDFTFVYFIDVDLPTVPTIRGKLEAFHDFKITYLDPLNEYLRTVSNPALNDLKEKTGLALVAVMRWDPWTDCDFCTGEKTRIGRCHFEPFVSDEERWKHCVGLCEFYKNALHMDCRSYWTMTQLFLDLAIMTEDSPNFQAVAKCVGTCQSDATPGFDFVKKLRTHVVNVGDSAVISCPGYSKKKNCYWMKNGVKLTSNEYDPFKKVSINELCMLYLNYVTKEENGNFTCFLDDKMIQQNKVIVEVIYSELDKTWWRHVVYLLYVILLCFIIIVGGIAIGCLQRENFQKLESAEMIEMYSTQRMEYEKLIPAE